MKRYRYILHVMGLFERSEEDYLYVWQEMACFEGALITMLFRCLTDDQSECWVGAVPRRYERG